MVDPGREHAGPGNMMGREPSRVGQRNPRGISSSLVGALYFPSIFPPLAGEDSGGGKARYASPPPSPIEGEGIEPQAWQPSQGP